VGAEALAVIVTMTVAAGCHLIYPLDPGVDAGADAAVCAEKITINPDPPCTAQCVEPAVADSDCDGLSDTAADHWTGSCNALMLAEELAAPPWARWEQTYAPVKDYAGQSCGTGGGRCLPGDECNNVRCKTKQTWSCGQLRLEPGQTFALTDAGTLYDATYLVELRFSITKITNSQRWSFGVTANDNGQVPYRRSCAVWIDQLPSADCVTGCAHVPGLHMNHTIPKMSTGAWTPDANDNKINDPLNRTFRLQLWGDDRTQNCSLLTENGAQNISVLTFPTIFKSQDFNPTTPGTIRVDATGCQATLDHLRVFDHAL